MARLIHRIVVALLLIGWGASSTRAGTGHVFHLPTPQVKPTSGLRLSVDTRWVDGFGYRPVRIEVSTLGGGPAPADRYIDVLIHPRGWGGHAKSVGARATVLLPQGSVSGEALLLIPQNKAMRMYEVECFEDGDKLLDLSQDVHAAIRYYYEPIDGSPAILVVHSLAPIWTKSGQRQVTFTGMTMNAFRPRFATASAETVYGMAFAPTIFPGSTGVNVVPMLRPAAEGYGYRVNLLPDIRTLAGRLPMTFANGQMTEERLVSATPPSDSEIMRLVDDLAYLEVVPPQSLPEDWLSYSSVDVMIVAFHDLRTLVEQFPTKWEAIQRWQQTGTTLVVYGVGEQYEHLGELTSYFPSLAPDGRVSEPDSGGAKDVLADWARPRRNFKLDTITVLNTGLSNMPYYWQQRRQSQANQPNPRIPDSEAEPLPFVHREVGEGRLVAMNLATPFPGTSLDWAALFNEIPAPHWLWYQRHGFSSHRANEEFWDFLIPGVGRAPVASFLALISIFALIMGPVNYYWLQRTGRLYLLLVTVPAGALVIGVSLFVYALLTDGFGVQARVRSFTLLDQRQGQATSWSRQTYYAGLAPSRGLVFPTDAAVYAIDYEPFSHFGGEDVSRRVYWGEEQQLARGFFLSRTAAQFMVVHPQPTKLQLQIEESSDGPPRVTNQLQTAVEALLVCDAQGRHFKARNLAPNQTVALQPAVLADEVPFWNGKYVDNRPAYPERFDPADLDNFSDFFGGGWRPSDVSPTPRFATSILETSLRMAISKDLRSLETRSYVALIQRPPLVPLGVDAAREPAGFHVLVGRW